MEMTQANQMADAMSQLIAPRTKAIIHLNDGTKVTLAEPCHDSMDIWDMVEGWLCDEDKEELLESSYPVEIRSGGLHYHYVVEYEDGEMRKIDLPSYLVEALAEITRLKAENAAYLERDLKAEVANLPKEHNWKFERYSSGIYRYINMQSGGIEIIIQAYRNELEFANIHCNNNADYCIRIVRHNIPRSEWKETIGEMLKLMERV